MLPSILIGWLAASLLIAFAGAKYRFGFWGYLFASILLSPVIGLLLLAAAVPPNTKGSPEALKK
jgi:hypothetical protein